MTRGAQVVEQLGGRADPDVGPDECLLELVPRVLVDATAAEEPGERAAGSGQSVPEGGTLRRCLDDLGFDDLWFDDRGQGLFDLGDQLVGRLRRRPRRGPGRAGVGPPGERGRRRRLELHAAGPAADGPDRDEPDHGEQHDADRDEQDHGGHGIGSICGDIGASTALLDTSAVRNRSRVDNGSGTSAASTRDEEPWTGRPE